MNDLIELFHKVGELKKLKRAGWVLKKIPNPESVADHSFRVAVMTLLLARKAGLNELKCVKMALIHDLAESIVGDLTPHDGITIEKQHELELNALKKLFSNNQELIDLWLEFEERKTLEAIFVRDMDKLEMALQALEYETENNKFNLNEFYDSAKARIKNDFAKELFELVLEKRKLIKK
ncbi:MAG: HD domain-containing protein [archaeon]